MVLLQPDHWPLWVICVGMILSGVIDGLIHKVPNWLTFPIILSGWALALMHNFDYYPLGEAGRGGIGTSLFLTFLGFLFGFVMYSILGWMGGGDGKMVMGFAAWIGAFYAPASRAVSVFLWSMAIGILVGGVIGLVMMAVRGNIRHNMQNMRMILLSFVTSSSVEQLAQKGKDLRAREPKLAYGVPLCIGFVGYLLFLYGWQTP